jgi:hypothetical protein
MTVMAELATITVTATAQAAVFVKGENLTALVGAAKLQVLDLKKVLSNIVAVHPSSGGDASSYAALTAVIAELA